MPIAIKLIPTRRSAIILPTISATFGGRLVAALDVVTAYAKSGM
jgi:hypothetical protein